ncbi:hypothetical protein LguiA_031917 [Lonicera macranthoides]
MNCQQRIQGITIGENSWREIVDPSIVVLDSFTLALVFHQGGINTGSTTRVLKIASPKRITLLGLISPAEVFTLSFLPSVNHLHTPPIGPVVYSGNLQQQIFEGLLSLTYLRCHFLNVLSSLVCKRGARKLILDHLNLYIPEEFRAWSFMPCC